MVCQGYKYVQCMVKNKIKDLSCHFNRSKLSRIFSRELMLAILSSNLSS